MKIAKVIISCAVFLLLAATSIGQTTDDQLAAHYFQEGDFEKAAMYYERLYNKRFETPYYNYLLKCYLQLETFDKAQKLNSKQQKRFSENMKFAVDEGFILEQMGEQKKAEKSFDKLQKSLPGDYQKINELSQAFINAGKDQRALSTLQKGNKLLPGSNAFTLEIAELLGVLDRHEEMMDMLFGLLLENEGYKMTVQNTLHRTIDLNSPSAARNTLKSRLIKATQEHPKETVFQEMLLWVFLQEENYHAALRQAKAIDLKNQENGFRVMEIAQIGMNAKAYDATIEATDYLISKGRDQNVYYFSARMMQLNVLKLKVTEQPVPDSLEVLKLISGYDTMLKEVGNRPERAALLKDKGEVTAYQLHDSKKGKAILESALEVPGVDEQFKAGIKLLLGDVMLGLGEIWGASLLYSQVDLDFKYDQLGEQAKFKNAKLSYYTGDFDWAKAQLDVLKGATSKFIANDALDLSLLITDNSTIDTTTTPLKMYASSELLILQNKLTEASQLLDEILTRYPSHALSDEIAFQRYKIAFNKGDFKEAETELKKVLSLGSDDILADNALFSLAQLYDKYLEQPEDAKAAYKKLLTDYSNSFFTTPARKRFRELRGDNLN